MTRTRTARSGGHVAPGREGLSTARAGGRHRRAGRDPASPGGGILRERRRALDGPRPRSRRARTILRLAESDGRRRRRPAGTGSSEKDSTAAPETRMPRSRRCAARGRARAERRSTSRSSHVRTSAGPRPARTRSSAPASPRVVAASRDPEPARPRPGHARSRPRAGIAVAWSGRAERRRAELQNEKFRTWITRGRPFVLAKWAATIDGQIATSAGESRWITGERARRQSLALREEFDAILVGAGTVIADDPRLTRRLGWNRTTRHRRIVLDGRLRIPESARASFVRGGTRSS